ncbi:ATP-binding protein [Haematospirillum jordaniae]|uniref:ATP-binding protein n=1 Tax=Haematospirillum jordaniae TaxID=1549855 RepID=A0A143DFD4_9PROT|nr:ATP-binding protein [Haematospirillum jordaniae]AMW35366.1 ATP-binding protein [Haematospirillum jordaniae]NKD45201.1 ATP-binding protein [Haematospirillum jordaniae]NKD56213.1 ATP-binding protein [Haematospirillum jordaniae]NKD58270.1 ATP-binding protein [Haematospirillum jordaniae]NKD66558.1 ATP-binding protein [Haematospirillum jordaniae]
MTVSIDMGRTQTGTPAFLDLEELLATRLLVQGNSGSGKSHLLRRLVEQAASHVQQVVIDPEGDFVTLSERFGHVVVDAAEHSENGLQKVAGRVREHRVSVVLTLEHQETERQLRSAAAFLGGLFDSDRTFWHPALVVVDEAQLFAPSAAGEISDEARKVSLGAMTNLMCRGRKRGLAGIIATQRLAKLAKNVAAEASNFLMGRTFLDIDMARAADLLGMERRQAEMFRDLQRGQFIALGPALSRRPLPIRIGAVETSGRSSSPRLLSPPPSLGEQARDLLMASEGHDIRPVSCARITPMTTEPLVCAQDEEQEILSSVFAEAGEVDPLLVLCPDPIAAPAPVQAVKPIAEIGQSAFYDMVLRDLLSDDDAPYRSVAVLYQDFLVRCRSHGASGRGLDLPGFRRRLAVVRAGLTERCMPEEDWNRVMAAADLIPEDLRALFLMLAKAAFEKSPCPSDADIAKARGSRSSRRARGLLSHLEEQGVIVIRDDVYGNRAIALPGLGWETAPGHPDAVDA